MTALLLAGAATSRAQSIAPAEPIRENATSVQPADRLIGEQNERIIFLLDQLADQARQSEDIPFAVRAQSQAATLIWPYEPERARAIYRRAFQTVGSRSADKAGSDKLASNHGNVERLRLRSELLNQIASRDPDLADELARKLAESAAPKDGCPQASGCDQTGPAQPAGAASAHEDTERREMLISVALRIVEREPQQAMALAQMSFPLGLSANLSRLLLLMRASEPGLADLLFSSAVARLEREPALDLADIHTLGAYLVSAGSAAREAMGRPLIIRFLNLAYTEIARRSDAMALAAGAARARRDDSPAAYFVGRQLNDLFARYQPDRLGELQRNITELTDAGSDSVVEPVSFEASGPAEMEAAALDSRDPHKRDALYARAALAWLAKNEPRRAQWAAFEIEDAEMRDRVLGQVVRKHSLEGRIAEAEALARCIEDGSSRVDAFVLLAGSALAAKNKPRAIEILSEAQTSSAKLRAHARINALLKVAGTVSNFDTARGFEIMQSVVKAINEAAARQPEEPAQPGVAKLSVPSDMRPSQTNQLYATSLGNTLALLARTDFERALLLAQQIEIKEAAIAAQLAVCRGGLAPKPPSNLPTTADDVEAGANPGSEN
jgi:hypothetical protein